MSIKVCKNQERVPTGKVRYDFYLKLNGKQYRKRVICQKSVVNDFQRKWETQITNGFLYGSHPLFETLNEYLKYSKLVKSKSTYTHEVTIVEKVIKVFFKNTNIQDIKKSDIKDFIAWRRNYCCYEDSHYSKNKVSNSTINKTINVLSYFFNWCIEKEYYKGLNPCYKVRLCENNIREVMLTVDQLCELTQTASLQDPQFYFIVLIALHTGMRRGEILNLQWSEVSFEILQIRLSRLKTKGKKARVIPITPSLISVFNNIKAAKFETVEDYVFSYTGDMLKNQWNKLLKNVSFRKINDGSPLRFHDLRHCFAQMLLNEGVDLVDIQWLLGHQDFGTTQRYATYARPDLYKKLEKLDGIMKVLQ